MAIDEVLDEARRRQFVERSQSVAPLYAALVTEEAHPYFAKGPRGIVLSKGDTVSVLEEYVGHHKSYHVVRSSSGDVGLFPLAYLEAEDETNFVE